MRMRIDDLDGRVLLALCAVLCILSGLALLVTVEDAQRAPVRVQFHHYY